MNREHHSQADMRAIAPPTTLRDKIAQLLVVRIGSNLPPIGTVAEDEGRVAGLLAECPIGGLVLFNGGASTRVALDSLQRASVVPLLVASDVERGVGQQVRGHTIFPHAMAFDRLAGNGPEAVGWLAEIVARESREAGINLALTPVADVNTNPKNPIISIRAFSEDADRVAELVASYVKVAEPAGVLTTAKHFPGHGDTHQDSHDSLPTVTRTLDELRSCELMPFQAAIDAGCAAIMTAHVAFPQIDLSGVPATLSPVLLQQVLREELAFDGAIVSDSLLMAGVRDRFATEGELALAVLTAGVDLLLDVKDAVAVVNHLLKCVEDGTLEESRVDAALERVWALKIRAFGPATDDSLVPQGIDQQITWEQFAQSRAEQVAFGAIEVLGSGGALLPLDPKRPLVAVLFKPFESPVDPPEQPLAAALRLRFGHVEYLEIGPHANTSQYKSAEQLAHGAAQLLLAMIVRPAAWHAFGLPPAQQEFVRRTTSARPVVVASLGVPYVLWEYANAAVIICTYSDVAVSQQALADFLVANR